MANTLTRDIGFSQNRHVQFSFNSLNKDILVDILYTVFKFDMVIPGTIIEGTMTQTCNIILHEICKFPTMYNSSNLRITVYSKGLLAQQ